MRQAFFRSLVPALMFLFFPLSAFAFGSGAFPCPAALAPRVAFWVRIFTEFGDNQRVIHDAKYPWVVYEVLDVDGLNQKQVKARVESRKQYYAALLQRMAKRDPSAYGPEEKRIADLLTDVPPSARFADARDRIRSQPGVTDQFRMGVRRAGRYLPTITAVLDSMKVPAEIAYLPFVESSFNPSARSKAGAVGLWQFTKRTAKRFLRVERDLDERLDPVFSTQAAARYLTEAYSCLGSWPLAVTAYNHGVGGMVKAKSMFGADDVGQVLLSYDGPAYGFASQNFYCEFLAAMEVARTAERHFGTLVADPPVLTDTFPLPDHVRAPTLAKVFSVPLSDLAELNPAFGPAVVKGAIPVPKGYVLRLPLGEVSNPHARYAAVPVSEKLAQVPARRSSGYKVRPGDTLAQIAKRHQVPLESLRRVNDLRTGDRIFPGQVLSMPDLVNPKL